MNLSKLARIAVVAVSFAAASLSFHATSHYAEVSGAVSAGYGPLAFVTQECAVLAAAALAFVRTSAGLKARLELAVVVALLGLSVCVNVADSSGGLLAHLIAGMPPLVLLVSLELVLRETRRSVAAHTTANNEIAAVARRDSDRSARNAQHGHNITQARSSESPDAGVLASGTDCPLVWSCRTSFLEIQEASGRPKRSAEPTFLTSLQHKPVVFMAYRPAPSLPLSAGRSALVSFERYLLRGKHKIWRRRQLPMKLHEGQGRGRRSSACY